MTSTKFVLFQRTLSLVVVLTGLFCAGPNHDGAEAPARVKPGAWVLGNGDGTLTTTHALP